VEFGYIVTMSAQAQAMLRRDTTPMTFIVQFFLMLFFFLT